MTSAQTVTLKLPTLTTQQPPSLARSLSFFPFAGRKLYFRHLQGQLSIQMRGQKAQSSRGRGRKCSTFQKSQFSKALRIHTYVTGSPSLYQSEKHYEIPKILVKGTGNRARCLKYSTMGAVHVSEFKGSSWKGAFPSVLWSSHSRFSRLSGQKRSSNRWVPRKLLWFPSKSFYFKGPPVCRVPGRTLTAKLRWDGI